MPGVFPFSVSWTLQLAVARWLCTNGGFSTHLIPEIEYRDKGVGFCDLGFCGIGGRMSRVGRNFRNRVGKYEFGRVLGEGTFGRVHLARDVETGEKRAIKVISKDRVVKDKMTEQVSLLPPWVC